MYWLDMIMTILTVLYAVLLLAYRYWFDQLRPFEINEMVDLSKSTFFTVIVPARNEAKNIKACIESILAQNYPLDHLEIMVVDDFSEDDTAFIVESLHQLHQNVRLLKLADYCEDGVSNAYKKKAIEIAVGFAKGDWIITTDADCIVPKRWLSLYDAYIQEYQPVFLAAPVMFIKTSGVLNQFQILDFMALQGITAAAVSAGKHSMSNGANLGFEKSAFIAVGGYQGVDHIASGDDMFLMHKMKQTLSKPIGYLFNKDAIVRTAAMTTWKDFIMQRIRWSSKARYYDDHSIIAVLLLVYFFNLSFIVLFFLGDFNTLIIALAFKTFFELLFLDPVARFFNLKETLRYFVLYQPLHIVYNVIAGLFGQIRTYTWKGRKVR